MTELSEEVKTLVTISRHVRLVQKNLGKIVRQLESRAVGHDLSKLADDEFKGFVTLNNIARNHEYGSPEYKQSLEANKGVIDLHFQRNSHHPEYYQNGVSGMSLVDIIEMVCDWKAASETYGQTSFKDSVDISIKRFNLTPEQTYLVRLIADELEMKGYRESRG